MKTNKLKYSKKDKLVEDEFDKKNTKIRITTFIDIDLIEKLKEEAMQTGKKYQTLLNEKLRQILMEEEKIKTTLFNLDKRLKIVEKRIKAG
jgi:uncharacterized protein (DUF4415 family)